MVLIALGAVAYVYAFSQDGTAANFTDQQTSIRNIQSYFAANNITLPDNATIPWCHEGRMPQMRENGLGLDYAFLQNATLSSVNGTIVATTQGLLILDSNSGQIRISLPREWTVGNEVITRTSLFNGTFASPGQSVTIDVLESNVFSNSNFTINMMMGYEAINATGTTAYAVLPFNIQPTS
jgi:hypothetical protein